MDEETKRKLLKGEWIDILFKIMISICIILFISILIYAMGLAVSLSAKGCDHPDFQHYKLYMDKSNLSYKKKNPPWRRSQYSPRGHRTSFLGKSYTNYHARALHAKNEFKQSRSERL